MKPSHSRRRLTITHMRNLAANKRGKCLSTSYFNARTHLSWQCKKGHVWQAIPANIIKGSWCPQCAGKKVTIEDMCTLAALKGGKCISTTYINNQTKLLFQCAKGHVWKTKPALIQQDKWCPHCAHERMKGTLEEMQLIAAQRGGKCLSTRYVNSYTKLEWECAKGHRWKQVPANVTHGDWCRLCTWNKGTIEQMQALAAQRVGKCLSASYTNARTHLSWQCAKGHQWKATPSSIKQGSWCPHCQRASL
jgi:hypothetical protein